MKLPCKVNKLGSVFSDIFSFKEKKILLKPLFNSNFRDIKLLTYKTLLLYIIG